MDFILILLGVFCGVVTLAIILGWLSGVIEFKVKEKRETIKNIKNFRKHK